MRGRKERGEGVRRGKESSLIMSGEYPMGGIRPSPSKKSCASWRSCWEGGDSSTGTEAGLTRIVPMINIKFVMKKEEVTQQMVQHLVLVLYSLENGVLIKLDFQETILVPESKRLWINVILQGIISQMIKNKEERPLRCTKVPGAGQTRLLSPRTSATEMLAKDMLRGYEEVRR